MITVTLEGASYTIPSVDAALSDLTGAESMMIEEYVGGFTNFGANTTKAAVVTVWLALRASGLDRSIDEIETYKGLVFGGVIDDDGVGEPEDPMKNPGRPLVAKNDASGSNGGGDGSAAIPAISGSSGGRA